MQGEFVVPTLASAHAGSWLQPRRRRAGVATLALLSAMSLAGTTVLEPASDRPLLGLRENSSYDTSPGTHPRRGIDPSSLPREPTPLSPELRARGHNACYMPDAGFGRYSHWMRVGSGAQMIVPRSGGHTPDWGYDVVIHFHGRDAVRSPFVQAVRGAVLVGIDLGVASGPYSHAFEAKDAFDRLLANISKGLQQASSHAEAHIRHLALSSWSAGFGAVTKILARHPGAIDSLILLDSLHSDYGPLSPGESRKIRHVASAPIETVMALADRAVRRDAFLFLSHSEIVPPGYASTTEVADFLLEHVEGARAPGEGTSPLGANLLTTFDREGMHVRGYQGGDKAAHCAHVELLAEVIRDYLEPAWGTPEATPEAQDEDVPFATTSSTHQ